MTQPIAPTAWLALRSQRSGQIYDYLGSHPEALPGIERAVRSMTETAIDAMNDGCTPAEMIAMHTAVGEQQSITQAAILAAAAITALAELVNELTATLDSHNTKMGFTAPELLAERQAETLTVLRSIVEQARESSDV